MALPMIPNQALPMCSTTLGCCLAGAEPPGALPLTSTSVVPRVCPQSPSHHSFALGAAVAAAGAAAGCTDLLLLVALTALLPLSSLWRQTKRKRMYRLTVRHCNVPAAHCYRPKRRGCHSRIALLALDIADLSPGFHELSSCFTDVHPTPAMRDGWQLRRIAWRSRDDLL
jgi:hypothetical protein